MIRREHLVVLIPDILKGWEAKQHTKLQNSTMSTTSMSEVIQPSTYSSIVSISGTFTGHLQKKLRKNPRGVGKQKDEEKAV